MMGLRTRQFKLFAPTGLDAFVPHPRFRALHWQPVLIDRAVRVDIAAV